MMTLPRRDKFLALLVVVIWGVHFFAIKAAVAQMDPLVALAIRFGIVGLLFLPFATRCDRKTFWKVAEIAVLMGAIHQSLLFCGLKYLAPATVSVLLQSQIVFSVLMGWWFLGEKFKWRTTLGIIISLIGIVVMLGVPDIAASIKGFAMIMISAIALSASSIRMRQLTPVTPATFVAILNLVSFVLVGISSLVFSGEGAWEHLGRADWKVMGIVLAYQAFVVSISHFWWQQLMSRNEVAKVTCFSLLTPLVGIGIALAMGASISLSLVIGTVLILMGLAVIMVRRVQKNREGPVVMVE